LSNSGCNSRVNDGNPAYDDGTGCGIRYGIKLALLELKSYVLRRPIDGEIGKSVDALVAAGTLSAECAGFLRDHHVQFCGFNSNPIA
jgi:hypothetical protein